MKNVSGKRMKTWMLGLLVLLFTAGCSGRSDEAVTFPDIHGLGYSADGKKLYVATQEGFRVWEGGKWAVPDLPKHNLIGFSAVSDGFYSSGHPDPASGQTTPLGVVKSGDEGKTLQTLAMAGEGPFPVMGVGYQNHAIFLYNDAPRAGMEQGYYQSYDDAKSWSRAEATGLVGKPQTIAVHPNHPDIVMIGTDQGLYVTDDGARRFELITNPTKITAVTFEPNGNRVFVAGRENQEKGNLFEIDLANGGVTRDLTLPDLGDDEIVSFAVNPANSQEMVFGTTGKNMYHSADNGLTWKQIATAGKGAGGE